MFQETSWIDGEGEGEESMPALNFNQFPDGVEAHRIRQSIRRIWKRPIKPGDTLYLYTGMRTKQCRLLNKARCGRVRTLKIDNNFIKIEGEVYCFAGTAAAHEFAKADGFRDWFGMLDWFRNRYGLPFEGVLIQW